VAASVAKSRSRWTPSYASTAGSCVKTSFRSLAQHPHALNPLTLGRCFGP
jgi:hypothetical protein